MARGQSPSGLVNSASSPRCGAPFARASPAKKPPLTGEVAARSKAGRALAPSHRRKLPFKHKRTRACARVFYASYYRAFLAVSTRALKLAGSWIAISDSILRFSSTPAFFRPFMKVE